MKIHNLKHIGHLDLPGGGQVSVKEGIAYVGHMAPPIGTSIVDVSNPKFGCHQPQEQVYDTILGVTWFSGGLRLVDIADPYRPQEVGYFIPDPASGYRSAQSNDVFYDGNGLLYLIDRCNGLDILERAK